VVRDETLNPWREHSIACGVSSTLAVPIVQRSRSIGVFLFCFAAANSITNEISALLERVVENVAFALERFERAERQKEAECAQREAENKEAALHRMYIAFCKTNEGHDAGWVREELYDLVCEAAVLGGHFTSTTIALAQPDDHLLKAVSTKGQNADRVAPPGDRSSQVFLLYCLQNYDCTCSALGMVRAAHYFAAEANGIGRRVQSSTVLRKLIRYCNAVPTCSKALGSLLNKHLK
jgi:hypothetical protein